MGFLTGGSKSKQVSNSSSQQSSWNDAFNPLNSTLGGLPNNLNTSSNALANLLGMNGGPFQDDAFRSFRDNSGYNFVRNEGLDAIQGSAAAKGILGSGSTLKALSDYGQNTANSFLDNYIQNLMGYGNIGLQAGQLLGQTGGRSTGTSTSTSTGTSSSNNGIGSLLGGAGALIAASDRRLKTNIEYLGTMDNGLNVYSYNYTDGRGPYKGVMADEVEVFLPEALGPVIDGYKTVDYSKVGDISGY